MRQTPRLPPHVGRNDPVRGPNTPKRTGDSLNELIRSLEAECQLGLQVRDSTWSPSKRAGSLEDKVQGQIKRCYFSSEPALRQTLQKFKADAERLPEQEERLKLLHLLLRSQTSTPQSSRVLRSQTPREDSHKSLRDQGCKFTFLVPISCSISFAWLYFCVVILPSPSWFILKSALSRSATQLPR